VEAITITLDGVEVSGYSGMTILDLARESGVDIPTLCYDPYLTSTGACRLCLVEDERSGALLAACVAPITAGMVINTRSPRVMERRKVIIQLMLASHPDSCLVCDKGNRCQLRKLASEMGIGRVELQRIPQLSAIEEANPLIERDLSKCILCAKCIRACQELVVEGALDYIGRGFTSKPTTLNDLPLEKSECTFCGTCVALCPTGALMEKERTYRGTTTTTVETVCPFCGCGCGLCLEVKDNQLVRARPGTESPVNNGTLCARGSYGYDFVHSPERLVSPLIKMEGSLQVVSWEQALDRAAAEFKRIKEDYGPDSLAVLGSSKCTNEENYLLQRLAAHLWLRPKVGTDFALINGLARVIIDERLYDEEFVARRTDNFTELARSLKAYTPEHVAEATGVSSQDVQLAARLLAEAERAAVVYGNGITQQVTGTDSVMALANLLMLTRNTGYWGGGIFALQRENNAQGACDMGSLPDFLPGYQDLEGKTKQNFEERWQACLPTNPGLTALEMIEQAGSGKLKGMLIMGENPASSFPCPSLVRKALASLELLVVADMFLTETAKLATVVLPAASFAEKEGTFTNFEGRVQPVRKAIAPLGDSLPDWDIILRLADNMGHPMPYSSPQQVMDEIEELVPLYQGLAYADPETKGLDWADLKRYRLGARRLYQGPFPSGFGRFSPVEYTPPTTVPGDEHQLILLSGSTLYHFGSGTRSLRASRLKKFSPHAWVEINSADAEHLGFGDGDVVRVCLLYTSPSPRDATLSRMPSSA